MLPGTEAASRLSFDTQALERLRMSAKTDPQGAVKEAARQFEALLLNMMLKSMRDAGPGDGLLDSEQTRFYTAMLDQQLAQTLAGRGLGLSDLIARQLGGASQPAAASRGEAGPAARSRPDAAPAVTAPTGEAPSPALSRVEQEPATMERTVEARARSFVDRMWSHAAEASQATGIPAHFILGQAALESGWGRFQPRRADGEPSHNLFGVKAGRSWSGAVVESATTEHVNGVTERRVERFRAYASYSEAFMDYARLLKSLPRYGAVLESGNDPAAFARELQRAGYATDPAYARKLERIITGPILRQGLLG